MNIWKTLRLANMMAEGEGGDDAAGAASSGGGSSMSMGDSAWGDEPLRGSEGAPDSQPQDSHPQGDPDGSSQTYSPGEIPDDHWTRQLGDEAKVMYKSDSGEDVEIFARDHPLLQRYENPEEVAKALIHANHKISSGNLVIPQMPTGEEVTEDQLAEYRNKYAKAVGAPESAEGYTDIISKDALMEQFKDSAGSSLVTVDDVLVDGFTEQAAALGLQTWQAEGLMKWFTPLNVDSVTRQAGVVEKTRLDELQAIKAEHKEGAKQLINDAYRGAKAVGGDELVAVLDKTTAGNYKVVMEAFAKIAPHFAETKGKDPSHSASTGELSLEELRSMQQDSRYHGRGDTAKDPAFVKKVEDGYKKLMGDQPHDSSGKSRG